MQLLKRTSVKKKQTSVINTDPHSSKTIPSHQKRSPLVAVSCGYGTCFAVKTCDELYHFIFSIDRVGITFGFQTIIWTFARHLVSRCLYFPATGITWSIWTFQFLPTGLHGLCFAFCFAGLLPLHSLTNGPLFKVRFGESLVVRLYSEIEHLHLSIEAQCVSHLLPLGDCHKECALQLHSHSPVLRFDFFRVLNIVSVCFEFFQGFFKFFFGKGVFSHVHHPLLISVFPISKALIC